MNESTERGEESTEAIFLIFFIRAGAHPDPIREHGRVCSALRVQSSLAAAMEVKEEGRGGLTSTLTKPTHT